jgi:ATP-dependent RNA helicase RhlE
MSIKNIKSNKPKRYDRPRYGRSSYGNNRKASWLKTINPDKFINKAVQGEDDENYVSKNSFGDFKISRKLLDSVLINKGYKSPTPIQDQIIPHIMKGFDVVGVANTGTGKTGAFLLPLIDKIIKNNREKVLIVTPTRELALQIDLEFKEFVKGMRIFSVCCVGGMNIRRQISDLRRNYNLIVGTPGRLKDLTERKIINLSYFKNVVLDEADRMFDMGFIKDTRLIINKMPKERQTLFFSATTSRDIEKMILEFTKDPVRVSVKTRDTSKNVEQDVIKIKRGRAKIETLCNLLNKKEFNKVLVFGRTKHGVEQISKTLIRKGLKSESIHGDKNNYQRQKALNMFKDNKIQVLVATDVAARGLNIDNISHVVNYDLPATYEDYIHRIGRTGRWNKKGIALTFIDQR